MLAMRDEGVAVDEIASRLKRSPEFVHRVIEWTQIPRSARTSSSDLTALQRRVLALRSDGEDHETIGQRFKKGPRFIRQVEGLAHFRKGLMLLEGS